ADERERAVVGHDGDGRIRDEIVAENGKTVATPDRQQERGRLRLRCIEQVEDMLLTRWFRGVNDIVSCREEDIEPIEFFDERADVLLTRRNRGRKSLHQPRERTRLVLKRGIKLTKLIESCAVDTLAGKDAAISIGGSADSVRKQT